MHIQSPATLAKCLDVIRGMLEHTIKIKGEIIESHTSPHTEGTAMPVMANSVPAWAGWSDQLSGPTPV